jgi:transposase
MANGQPRRSPALSRLPVSQQTSTLTRFGCGRKALLCHALGVEVVELLKEKYAALRAGMNEAMRRRWAAVEARALGYGGAKQVAEATGLSLPTIRRGLRELDAGIALGAGRQRLAGAGRPRRTTEDRTLLADLDALVDPVTRGDPGSPLRWTCKSTTQLAEELRARGHAISYKTVGRLLHELHYSLQADRKTHEGADHPDRDAQFRYIARQVQQFQRRGQPVISVDTKKKELVGNFKNAGREWQPKGEPVMVNAYDFPRLADGKAIPYGIYDLAQNEGWVSVGTDHDTPAFAVAAIREWWLRMGKSTYPTATELLITADSGGSNSARARLWKVELQRLADQTGLRITVCHFPPGTSKWNKIEHRLFCHITANWRGRPLVSYQVVVNLIALTTTATGLEVRARLDRHHYPTGIKVTDEELAAVQIKLAAFHGNWNYTIAPRRL